MVLAYTTSDLHAHCPKVHNSSYSWLDVRIGKHTLNLLFDEKQVILYKKILSLMVIGYHHRVNVGLRSFMTKF